MDALSREDLDAAIHWSQEPGESIAGTVAKIPEPGAFHGRSLVLWRDGGLVLVDASAAAGHTVLANELASRRVAAGDAVSVEFVGWREGGRGQRYRHYRVRVQRA